MTGPDAARQAVDRGGRILLGLAAVAVGFAAADNYVVVLALPDMMGSAGLSAEDLQQAAPIVSGFLLGYIAMLPLIGRIADLRGRLPVLVGALVVFGLGSLVTAAAYDLPSVVVGRLLQGVGAGGLLPPTLALVADLYPPRRRGVPLGVVGAVQELGNVVGPVYGAVVLAFGSWRTIFWINLAVGLVLAVVIRGSAGRHRRESARPRRVRLAGPGAGGRCPGVLVLVMASPRGCWRTSLGLAFLPVAGSSRWLSPLALAAALPLLLVVRCLLRAPPLLDLRAWGYLREGRRRGGAPARGRARRCHPRLRDGRPRGAGDLAGRPWLLAERRRRRALLAPQPVGRPPPGAAARADRDPGWGAMVVSFFVGSGLIAALVDIPIFARLTVYTDSQLMAALVLVRFLVGLPVGAFARRVADPPDAAGVVTALGMAASRVGFGWMSPGRSAPREPDGHGAARPRRDRDGLAVAPANAALLSVTAQATAWAAPCWSGPARPGSWSASAC